MLGFTCISLPEQFWFGSQLTEVFGINFKGSDFILFAVPERSLHSFFGASATQLPHKAPEVKNNLDIQF